MVMAASTAVIKEMSRRQYHLLNIAIFHNFKDILPIICLSPRQLDSLTLPYMKL